MRDRFAEPALSVQAHRKIVMRKRTARLALHDISIMSERLVKLPGLEQNVRKICFGLRTFRLGFERCLETAKRAVEFAFLHKRRAKLEIHIRIFRMTGRHNFKLRDRFVESMRPEQKFAHVEMGNVVLLGNSKSPAP